jgi:LPS export ABC transporter protein LptC
MHNLNNIRRILAFLVVAAAAYVTGVIALKVHRVKGPSDILSDLPKNIDLSLRKVRYTNTKDGTLQWDLVAKKVDYYNDSGIIRFTGAEMMFSGKGKTGGFKLTADTADYRKKTGDVRLFGHVTASAESGLNFSTGYIEYLADKKIISTRDRVKLFDGNFALDGSGMEVHLPTKMIRISSNVTATVGARKK